MLVQMCASVCVDGPLSLARGQQIGVHLSGHAHQTHISFSKPYRLSPVQHLEHENTLNPVEKTSGIGCRVYVCVHVRVCECVCIYECEHVY